MVYLNNMSSFSIVSIQKNTANRKTSKVTRKVKFINHMQLRTYNEEHYSDTITELAVKQPPDDSVIVNWFENRSKFDENIKTMTIENKQKNSDYIRSIISKLETSEKTLLYRSKATLKKEYLPLLEELLTELIK